MSEGKEVIVSKEENAKLLQEIRGEMQSLYTVLYARFENYIRENKLIEFDHIVNIVWLVEVLKERSASSNVFAVDVDTTLNNHHIRAENKKGLMRDVILCFIRLIYTLSDQETRTNTSRFLDVFYLDKRDTKDILSVLEYIVYAFKMFLFNVFLNAVDEGRDIKIKTWIELISEGWILPYLKKYYGEAFSLLDGDEKKK